MTTRVGILAVVSLTSLVLAAGCAADAGDADDEPLNADSDLTSSVSLPSNGTKNIALNASRAGDVTITIDCHPPADPDSLGTVIKVDASSLGGSASDPARDGYYQLTTNVSAGAHSIKVTNQGPAATCSVRTAPVAAAATCKAWSAWRSPNTDHTHLRVGVEAISAGWEPFPASGNHWGAWAPWNKVYDKAIKRGFMLHNLEHGGLVFSYKCSTATESNECKSERQTLLDFANSLGMGRVLITPDPTQPQKFAIRSWRWAYSSDCFDQGSASAFAKAHIRHGREDIDADVPIPFDPTTTNVPCHDLMAAPDSCN
jgi:hypothetical protein